MSTATTFSRRVDLRDIPDPAKSVGAHLAAKLQLFNTDERTLTDELCDMLCIWLVMQSISTSAASSPYSFTLTLSKTTAAEETKNGADLELIISSPLGFKRCLIQAKVMDPTTRKLRCDSKVGWSKLRSQLVAARNEVGDLAFLLVYVPGGLLDGNTYGYGTYEQSSLSSAGVAPAFQGATLVPVADLLRPSGRWISRKEKVPLAKTGEVKNGLPFWRVLIELLLCRRSAWTSYEELKVPDRMPAFRRLSLGASEISEEAWRILQQAADHLLSQEGEPNGGASDA